MLMGCINANPMANSLLKSRPTWLIKKLISIFVEKKKLFFLKKSLN
jgi:hypothetical protein